jgi:hypothetical protein
MPGASFHSFYWQTQGAGEPPVTPGASGSGGYTPWQSVNVGGLVLICVLLG